MPLYGSVFGVHAVLRLSVILYLYAMATHILYRYLGVVGPVLSGIAFAVVSTVQIMIIPTWLLWLYERLLLMLEPCLQVVEVLMIVSVALAFSSSVMDFDTENPPWGKVIVAMTTLFSYTMSPLVFWLSLSSSVFLNNPWFACSVMALCVVLALMTLYKDEGIMSDAALLCLASSMTLLVAQWEASSFDVVRQTRFDSSPRSGSLLDTILSMPHVSLGYANQPIELFRKVFSLPFWFVAALRVSSAIWFIHHVRQLRNENDFSASDVSYLSDVSVWSSLLIDKWRQQERATHALASISVTLVSILVCTQIVVVHLTPWTFGATIPTAIEHRQSAVATPTMALNVVGMFRCVQSVGFAALYFYRLWHTDRDVDW